MLHPFAAFKRRFVRLSKSVGIALYSLWAGYNVWNKDRLYRTYETENTELRSVIADVVVKITNTNYDINAIPFPMGYKVYVPEDDSFRMVKFNQAYRDRYGITNLAVFGRKVSGVSAAGKIWESNDRRVLKLNPMEVLYVFEPYSVDGQEGLGRYAKWKVVTPTGIYVYWMEVQ